MRDTRLKAETENETAVDGAEQLDRDWLADVERALRAEDDHAAFELVRAHSPAEVSELLINLPLRRARSLFALLPVEVAAVVLTGISEELRVALMVDSSIERIAGIADTLEQDDAVDLLLDLPEEIVEPVLAAMESSDELRDRLQFEEDTAGGIMSNKFVAVLDDWDVGTATRMIRRKATEIQKLYEIYVVDEDRRLVGRLKLRDLLLNDRETPVNQLMRELPASVGPEADQEEVLELAQRLNLQTVPVVDADNRVIGRITVDELAEIVRDEAEEDMMIMGGVAPDALPDDSVGRIIRSRLPWLIGGLVGASLAGLVVGGFEDKINQAAILASFIPVVMAMAGNAGIQASTVTVQGLAAGNVWLGDFGSRLGKEFLGSLINGILVAVVLGLLVMTISQFVVLKSPGRLAIAAGLSVATVTVMAATLGAAIPLILKRFGVDPAVASGVFITTANDIFGVIVYFLIASSIYLTNAGLS
ncbi:MAG: magnesium transporter [Woeseiaceae bacterium]|jgi:magnesium transporter|nr:magnesium transporter [Woeseiaceae bacterium]